MASPTLQEQLDAVNSAIFALVSGAKSYSIGGRTVNRENLKELREWRRELQEEVGLQTNEPSRNYAQFGSR